MFVIGFYRGVVPSATATATAQSKVQTAIIHNAPCPSMSIASPQAHPEPQHLKHIKLTILCNDFYIYTLQKYRQNKRKRHSTFSSRRQGVCSAHNRFLIRTELL
jgi:hypothetical protein